MSIFSLVATSSWYGKTIKKNSLNHRTERKYNTMGEAEEYPSECLLVLLERSARGSSVELVECDCAAIRRRLVLADPNAVLAFGKHGN